MLSNYAQDDVPDSWERFDVKVTAPSGNAASLGKGRDKSAPAEDTKETIARVEVLWRVVRNDKMRPEMKAIYDSGALDCFTGG
jgi:hypothetical protein